MSVDWYWKHKVGEVIYFDNNNNKRWKLEMFGGNMMCAFIYRYKELNKETNKKEKWYNFFTWFNDIEHAKRILQHTKLEDLPMGNHIVKKIRLCISSKTYKYSNKEMLKLAKLFVQYGYKVELY